jgi:ABC-type nitrate/sulfonate/bicarbonate transport system permease component
MPLGSFVASFFVSRSSIWRSVLAAYGALLLAAVGGIGFAMSIGGSLFGQSSMGGLGAILTILAPIAGIYVLVCCFWYARREAVSLAVGSKGGSSTPIAISGISGFGLFNSAALKALTAEPASDAEPMIKELGAVITDIQALGDLGIQKWKSA